MRDLKYIFHVDDEPDIREIVRMSLEMLGGFDIEQFASGEDVLARAKDAVPDLVLLDVMMPGLDGEETYLRLRDMDGLAETPIIFMTARASEQDFRKLKDLGATDVFLKPFDPMALPDKLREVWRSFGNQA